MTVAWVIGSSGLLGSALCRELRGQGVNLFSPTQRFCWDNEQLLAQQLAEAVHFFNFQVGDVDKWEIFWAAGVGTMSSPASTLAPETNTLSVLMRLIERQPQLTATKGNFVLASSAGAIYAGSVDNVISENTPPAPTTEYAYEKLKQEDLLRLFTLANGRVTGLIMRISTLYGPGHSSQKRQGLITHIARCIIRNQPIQIYVPLDTIRDYITADDAAAKIIATAHTTTTRPGNYTKIIASEKPTTIAEIVSYFKKISRRNPRLITSSNKLSNIYSRRMQFRSLALRVHSSVLVTSLPVGIAQVLAAERVKFVQSRV